MFKKQAKCWLMTVICMFTCIQIYAQQSNSDYFRQGYQAYTRNQFKRAEPLLKKAQAAAKTNEDKAFIMKFLGTSQFMMGERHKARETYILALGYDGSLNISDEEVLDPSVIPFFTQIKAETSRKSRTAKSKSVDAKSSQQNIGNMELSKTKGSKKLRKKSRKKRKKRKSRSDSSNIGYTHYFPLGLPQISNGEYRLAGMYAAGQVVSLGYYLKISSDIAGEEEENNQVAANPELTQEQIDTFLKANNTYIEALTFDANIALLGAGLIYVGSVVHGILNASSKTKKSKSSQKNTYHEGDADSISIEHWDTQRRNPQYSLGVAPLQQGMGILVSVEF